MRLLLLEKFAETTISREECENREEEKLKGQWKLIGISSSSNQLVDNLKWDCRKIQALLQDGQEFAVLDLRTMEISKLELANSVAESSAAFIISPDGQTFFGFQSNGEFFAVCNNSERVKQIRPGYGMTVSKRPSIFDRMFSNVKSIFGYVSPSQQESQEDYERLFPMLQSTKDGLALVCFFKPGEGFIFTCSYSTALKHKHVSNIVGDRVPGRWWRIFTDEEIVLNWLRTLKTLPVLELQVDYAKGEQRESHGVIAYSAFLEKKLEILYGQFGKVDTKYEMKWGLIQYQFDWIILEDKDSFVGHGKINFITKVAGKADKIAIAVNTYMGVYIYVQNLPGEKSEVKLERMTVPLCPHCDYGNAIYYDEECWISSIEWLSNDCYFACTTRCGSLSFFHKSGEVMIMKMKLSKYPTSDRPCNFFHEVFNIRTFETEKAKAMIKDKNKPDVREKSLKVLMTWSTGEENVLGVFSDSKISFIRILKVSNYFGLCDIKIPLSSNLLRVENPADSCVSKTISGTMDKSNQTFKKWETDNANDVKEDCDGNKVLEKNLEENYSNSGERIISSINEFVNSLPEAEIILRPVFVHVDTPGSRKPPVQFKFNQGTSKDKDGNWKLYYDAMTSTEADENKHSGHPTGRSAEIEKENVFPLTFPEMETDFTLLQNFPIYTADDEGTDSRVTTQESTSPHWKNECVTPEPQFRPEYPDEYTRHETDSGRTSDFDANSGSNKSYSPPFTDEDEEADEKSVPCNNNNDEDQLGILRNLPVPQIDYVIPYVPQTPFQEVDESRKKLPVQLTSCFSNKCIATQTDELLIMEDDEYRNTGINSQRCRPMCMITKPPPPSKAPSQQYFIISDRKRIDATISCLTENDRPIVFINKMDDDQLGQCPSTHSSQHRISKQKNYLILEGKISETVTERLKQLKSDRTEANNPEDTSEKKINNQGEDKEKLSRERWEKLSGMFERKNTKRSKNTSANKKPQLPGVGIDVPKKNNFEEETCIQTTYSSSVFEATTGEENFQKPVGKGLTIHNDVPLRSTQSCNRISNRQLGGKNNSAPSSRNKSMSERINTTISCLKENDRPIGFIVNKMDDDQLGKCPSNHSTQLRKSKQLERKISETLTERLKQPKSDTRIGTGKTSLGKWENVGNLHPVSTFSHTKLRKCHSHSPIHRVPTGNSQVGKWPTVSNRVDANNARKSTQNNHLILERKISETATNRLKQLKSKKAEANNPKKSKQNKPLIPERKISETATNRLKQLKSIKIEANNPRKSTQNKHLILEGKMSETITELLKKLKLPRTEASNTRKSKQNNPPILELKISETLTERLKQLKSDRTEANNSWNTWKSKQSDPLIVERKISETIANRLKKLKSNKTEANKPRKPKQNNNLIVERKSSETVTERLKQLKPDRTEANNLRKSKQNNHLVVESKSTESVTERLKQLKSDKTEANNPKKSKQNIHRIFEGKSSETVTGRLKQLISDRAEVKGPENTFENKSNDQEEDKEKLSRERCEKLSSMLERKNTSVKKKSQLRGVGIDVPNQVNFDEETSLQTTYSSSVSEPTTDEEDYEKTVGKGLTIHNEVMEDVPLRSTRSCNRISNRQLGRKSKSAPTSRDKLMSDDDTTTDDESRTDRSNANTTRKKQRSDDNTDTDEGVSNDGRVRQLKKCLSNSRTGGKRKMKRRVSFCDPIAVFKIMAPATGHPPESED